MMGKKWWLTGLQDGQHERTKRHGMPGVAAEPSGCVPPGNPNAVKTPPSLNTQNTRHAVIVSEDFYKSHKLNFKRFVFMISVFWAKYHAS